MRHYLVQYIPDMFARCVELDNTELQYYLFDRMLEITLRSMKDEEKMVSHYSRNLNLILIVASSLFVYQIVYPNIYLVE